MTDTNDRLDIEEKIDRYVNGQLSPEETEELWAELIQHDEYIDYLKTTANLKEVVREKETTYATSDKAYGWIYAAAAAVVLILMVLGTMRLGYFQTPSDLQPVESIELDYYRAVDEGDNFTDREKIIRNALKLYNQDQFDEAVNLLQVELDRAMENSAEVDWIAKLDLTLGTLFYNTDRFNNAAFYFREIIENYKHKVTPLTLEKAYWYLGNSYFQMDMLEEAEVAMQNAYELDGAYSRVAKSYLDAMANVMATQSK